MSDDETEQQETDKETPWLGSLSENAHFNLAIKVLAGLAAIVTIVTGVSRLFGENFNIPFYEYLGTISVISSMVFTIAGLSLYFIVIRPGNRRLKAENASLKESPTAAQNYRTLVKKTTRIQELESDLSRLEQESERHKASYERYKELNVSDKAQYQRDIDRLNEHHKQANKLLSTVINDHQWLIDRATKERAEFPHCLSVEKFDYIGQLKKMPGICFMLKVRNYSVFDLILEEKVEGFLQYHGVKWTGTRITLRNDVGIAAGDVRDVGIEYNLLQTDLDYFLANQDNWKDGNEFCAFVTTNLRLMARGAKEEYLITPQPINLHDWRIYDRTK